MATSWCWVKSRRLNRPEYGGSASAAACTALLASSTGDRVIGRVVSIQRKSTH
jgi:hypothetical protein